MVDRRFEAGSYRKKHPETDEPLEIKAGEVGILLRKGNVAVIDVREGHVEKRPRDCVELLLGSCFLHFGSFQGWFSLVFMWF